ncbi:MAG: hypothetical protein JRF33_11340 [Deltaproteobacteria bacterium]|nr:hypothetical protein [Deltaproteobacteria bacterium]
MQIIGEAKLKTLSPVALRNLEMLQKGEATLAEMKGINDEEMRAGMQAGQRLMEAGEYEAAAEVFAGLALYDPYRSDVWQALGELFQRLRQPSQARLFESLARSMMN